MIGKLYLPQEADNFDETLETVKKCMSAEFGGYTVYPQCVGGWISDDEELVEEPVTVIESYTSDSNDVYALMGQIARLVGATTDEDSVMYSINSEVFFV